MASPLAIFVTILALVGPTLADDVPVNNRTIKDSLTYDFYKSKCPNVENIIMDVMKKSSPNNPAWIPGVLRTYFHDCFISGCDASILLKPERYNSFAPELAHPSNRLRGLDAIDVIKAELEKQCPGVVSCADILAYAARDAAVLAGNTYFKMPAGRRDSGFVDGNLAVNLPGGNFNTKDLIRLYADRGLTVDDMVILEGAHSVGEAKCVTTIVDDLNLANVTGSAEIIDSNFREMMLKKYCPKANESNWSEIPVPMIADKSGSGSGSGSAAWGVSFFNNIIKGKGVITSDVPFAVYPSTKDLVRQYANDSALWMKKFGETMVKLGKMDVLTGEQGEIRRHCSVQNAANMHA